MNATARTDGTVAAGTGGTAGNADAIVAARLRAAAAIEPLPGEAKGRTAAELAANLAEGSPYKVRFVAEIAAAVRGTALALAAARPHPADLWAAAAAAHPDPSVWFEQAVLLGHPAHPLARSRGELTDDEIRAYAPEHGARIELGLYRIPNREANGSWLDWSPRPETPLVPVHPWQAARLGLGEPDAVWSNAAPLMSVRTVALEHGNFHVKTAVDLQLTSAVRRVSPAAIHNGQTLSALLSDAARRHGITLLPEMAIWAPGEDGAPDPALSAIVRLRHRGRVVPLAALAEPCPATGRPIAAALAGKDLESWWAALVSVALAPLRLFAATGVALEAHGQNTLASFTGDVPTSLVYRDFGGVRVPPDDWPGVIGDLPEPDPEARLTKLLAALFPTTLTAIVDALAAWTGTDPGRWWRTVADAVRDLDLPGDMGTAVLKAPWPIKATTAMRLAEHPTADIWVRVDNPLAAA